MNFDFRHIISFFIILNLVAVDFAILNSSCCCVSNRTFDETEDICCIISNDVSSNNESLSSERYCCCEFKPDKSIKIDAGIIIERLKVETSITHIAGILHNICFETSVLNTEPIISFLYSKIYIDILTLRI